MAPRKSSVWKYFTICPAPNEHMAECTLCDEYSLQRYFSRGKCASNYSTKPLWNHLQCKHLRVFKELQKEGQTKTLTVASSWSLASQPQRPAWEPRKLRYMPNPIVMAPQSHPQPWDPSEAKFLPEPVATAPNSYQQPWEASETKRFHEPKATVPQSHQQSWDSSEMKSLNNPNTTTVAPFLCE